MCDVPERDRRARVHERPTKEALGVSAIRDHLEGD